MTAKKADSCTPGASAFACGLPTPQLDGLPGSIQSLMRAGMPLQGTWLELCGWRISAWLEWPATVCTCKSMTELTGAQIEYLTTMHRHYADCLDGTLRDPLTAPESFEDTSAEGRSGQDAPELDRKAA